MPYYPRATLILTFFTVWHLSPKEALLFNISREAFSSIYYSLRAVPILFVIFRLTSSNCYTHTYVRAYITYIHIRFQMSVSFCLSSSPCRICLVCLRSGVPFHKYRKYSNATPTQASIGISGNKNCYKKETVKWTLYSLRQFNPSWVKCISCRVNLLHRIWAYQLVIEALQLFLWYLIAIHPSVLSVSKWQKKLAVFLLYFLGGCPEAIGPTRAHTLT